MSDFSFERLVKDVTYIHNATSGMANRAVNQLLTLRNWIIGYYIVEFEQHGRNRAEYGSNLLGKLADKVHITAQSP